MNYKPEFRTGVWLAVDREAGVELACWFESEETCVEVGTRTEDGGIRGQFMTNIPIVLVDTPVPRPEDVKHLHPSKLRAGLAKGLTAEEIFRSVK